MDQLLVAFSNQLADAVDSASGYVVAVHGRPRVSSSGVHLHDGYIVTADHALRRDDEVAVTLPSGAQASAKIAGRDPGTDLALLQVDAGTIAAAPRTATASGRTGDLLLVVGRSAATGISASMGVLSASGGKWRTWRGGQLDQYLRLDAAMPPGASGAAVINAAGEWLGIATSGLSRSAGVAIPASTIENVVQQLASRGHVARGYFGVALQPVPFSESLRSRLSLETDSGLIVLTVEPGGPAEAAGVVLGDIFLALDGQPVSGTGDVQGILAAAPIGGRVRASLLRGGQAIELQLTVGERK